MDTRVLSRCQPAVIIISSYVGCDHGGSFYLCGSNRVSTRTSTPTAAVVVRLGSWVSVLFAVRAVGSSVFMVKDKINGNRTIFCARILLFYVRRYRSCYSASCDRAIGRFLVFPVSSCLPLLCAVCLCSWCILWCYCCGTVGNHTNEQYSLTRYLYHVSRYHVHRTGVPLIATTLVKLLVQHLLLTLYSQLARRP